jgi:hypothetical protein
VSASIDGEHARHLPGTGGDPVAAAQDLPGVARPAPGATGLVVWGAAPAETRVLFDGVEIPALYHFGGFRSAVGGELVERIEVVPGAYGAEYGRALGGLVRIEPRRLEANGTHLLLDANLLDASASVRTTAFRRLRVAAAGRTSYLGDTYGRLAPRSASALFPIPRYSDAQLEAILDVAPRATLRALVLTSLDAVRREPGTALPGLPVRVEDDRHDWWRAALTYEERGDDEGLGATLFAGGDSNRLDQRFGSTPASQARSGSELGLRAHYGARVGPGLRLRLGLDALLERARVRQAGSLGVPAREGDVTFFGQPPGADTNADTWSATVADLGPFLTVSLAQGPWRISPGLRADAFAVDGSRALPPIGATPVIGYARLAWALDPRLSIAYTPGPTLSVTVGGGIYHQPVDPGDLSAVFGSPALGPARAVHATLSVLGQLTELTSVTVTGFYRRIDGLAVRSPLATPRLAEALVAQGAGRSFGSDVVVRRELGDGTLAWLTYSLSRSERWTTGGPARPFDLDQTHVVTGVASHQRGAWVLGGRVRYATGMPRTPVVGSFFDVRDGVPQPIFGGPNSARLPAFFQVDARVDRTLVGGSQAVPVRVDLYLDVENVTGRRNAEEIVYSRDFTTSGYLTGVPLLVLVGVRLES